ncbi:glutathione S-transferase [Hyaloraphidium curvatum]|nr:glutathione S-transferase [Hyaloraphidium curvatum]
MERPADLDKGLHLFTGSGSPYARRAHMALVEKGLPFTDHLISFSNRDNKQPWYLELNPRGQVPLLVDDGKPLGQSAAILLYLESKGGKALTPADPYDKARAFAHVAEMDDKLYGDVEHDIYKRGLKKDAPEEDLKELNEKVDKELAVWESYLAKSGTGFLVGDSVTVADVTLFPFLALVSVRLGFDFASRSVPLPNLAKWYETMSKRPSAEASHPPHWKTSSPPAQPLLKKA